MADLQEIQEHLKEIWQALRQAGVTDEVTAVEHVAALLVEQRGLELPESLHPRRIAHIDVDVTEMLKKAVTAGGVEQPQQPGRTVAAGRSRLHEQSAQLQQPGPAAFQGRARSNRRADGADRKGRTRD